MEELDNLNNKVVKKTCPWVKLEQPENKSNLMSKAEEMIAKYKALFGDPKNG